MGSSGVFVEDYLINRLRRGDITAFDAIYWQYHEAIYRNILRFTKDEDAAADLLQDVFVKFWEKRSTLKPGKSISGLLFVISYHLAINHSKKMLRELLAKNELSIQLEEDDNDDPTTLELQHQLLEQAMASLTPQKQQVFTRCKLEGKSYEEVAEELGISKHTVKEHLSIAMKAVKAYIQQHAHSLTVSGLAVFLDYCGQ